MYGYDFPQLDIELLPRLFTNLLLNPRVVLGIACVCLKVLSKLIAAGFGLRTTRIQGERHLPFYFAGFSQ
jgi:hypothetical protein